MAVRIGRVGPSLEYPVVNPSSVESPLDPFMAQFLDLVERADDGFQPGPESKIMAERLDLPVPFVDALFTSARMRGLLKPAYGRGSKIRWRVSPAGAALTQDHRLYPDRDSG